MTIRTVTISIFLLSFGLVACSTQGVRESASTKMAFTSPKPAERVAGCIYSGWTSSPVGARSTPATNSRTNTGWEIVSAYQGAISGVATVQETGSGSTVHYATDYGAFVSKEFVPAIKACL